MKAHACPIYPLSASMIHFFSMVGSLFWFNVQIAHDKGLQVMGFKHQIDTPALSYEPTANTENLVTVGT
jgi:hypothetical protein